MTTVLIPDRYGGMRWGASAAFVIALHAAAAAALLDWHETIPATQPAAAAVVVDLAPLAVSPSPAVNDLQPGPAQSRPTLVEPPKPPDDEPKPTEQPQVTKTEEPKPVELAKKPAPVQEIQLPPQAVEPPNPEAILPAQRPPEASKPPPAAPSPPKAATAPPKNQRVATRSAAPVDPQPGVLGAISIPDWRGAVVAQIERHKRYPTQAMVLLEEGVVQVGFSIDRNGHVLSVRLVKSSGSESLDEASLLLVYNADPFPPPPPELPGARINITMPVRYHVRN